MLHTKGARASAIVSITNIIRALVAKRQVLVTWANCMAKCPGAKQSPAFSSRRKILYLLSTVSYAL